MFSVGEVSRGREASSVVQIGGRRREEIHPDCIVRLVIDPLAMQGVILHSRAHAAGEILEHPLVFLLLGASDRHHVRHAHAVRVKRGKRVIEQHAFVKIGEECIWSKREQPPRQL